MDAAEARKISHSATEEQNKVQYDLIAQNIKQKALNGETYIYGYSPLLKGVHQKLIDDGYVVEIIHAMTYYKVSW